MPRILFDSFSLSMVALCLAAFVFGLLPWSAEGQTLEQRIEDMQRREARQAERERAEAEAAAPDLRINERLATRISFVAQELGAREALERWAQATGVPLAIDWNALELQGVDADQPVVVELESVPAEVVLLVLMDAMSEDLDFVAEAHDWGLLLRSRPDANRDVMTRVYDVRDLLVDVPDFNDAPRLSLTESLSNTSSGGGGGQGVFDVDEHDDEDRPLSRRERGELLIQLVRDTIEPDLWVANGGEFSKIRYRDGKMIVRAPLYVHMQIGRPSIR